MCGWSYTSVIFAVAASLGGPDGPGAGSPAPAEPAAARAPAPEDEKRDETQEDETGGRGDDCLRPGCHDARRKQPAVHAPVDALLCDECHKPVAGEEHAFELVEKEEDLCTSCHAGPEEGEEAGKKAVHPPFARKACLSCHDPHGGSSRAFLVSTDSPLCLDCHTPETGRCVHQPFAGADCLKCHLPHGSEHAKLTRAAEPDLCFACHRDVAESIKSSRWVHGPVASGQCSSCHESHGASHPRLLAAFHSAGFYEGFSEEKYELCFLCHDAARFLDPQSTETGFRDGARNLHYLHVNKPVKGRSCRACHNHPVHAAPSPKLIRRSVPFGKWELPIGFEATAGGGRCAPGCHRPVAYTRDGGSPLPGPDRGSD